MHVEGWKVTSDDGMTGSLDAGCCCFDTGELWLACAQGGPSGTLIGNEDDTGVGCAELSATDAIVSAEGCLRWIGCCSLREDL